MNFLTNLMGTASSQLAGEQAATQQSQEGGARSPAAYDNEQGGAADEQRGTDVETATPKNSRSRPWNEGRSARNKLKTYSGKKKRASAGETRMVADDEQEEDEAELPGLPEVRLSEAAEEAHPAAEADTEPGATQTPNRRERVTRNNEFLKQVRSSRSANSKEPPQRRGRAKQAQMTAQLEGDLADVVPTPPSTEQIPDEVKVSAWLASKPGDDQTMAHSQEANDAQDYGALLHQANEHAVDEEVAEPMDDEYAVPSDPDSGTDFQPVDEEDAPKRASKTKGKRKRDSENAAPAKKRQRKSDVTAPKTAAAGGARNPKDFPESGNFTPIEVKLVEEAFEEACRDNNMTMDDMITKIQASATESQAVLTTILSDILPNRQRKALQRFCRRHFNNVQRGKWTDEQDDLLRAAQAERANKWVWIGQRVGRWPEDCRDRWRNFLALGDTRHTDIWTRDEEVALAKAIAESVAAIREKLDRNLTPEEEDEYIAWPVIIQKMGGLRNRLQCANKWKKIRQQAEKERNGTNLDPLDPQESKTQKATARKRFKAMKFGDIHCMLKELEYGNFIGRIDHGNSFWSAVTRMHPASPYTTQDRKQVYKKLRSQIADSGDFHTNVQLMLRFVETEFADLMHERLFTEEDAPSKGKKTGNAGGGSKRKSDAQFKSEKRVEESDDGEGGRAPVAVMTGGGAQQQQQQQQQQQREDVLDPALQETTADVDVGAEPIDPDDDDEESDVVATPVPVTGRGGKQQEMEKEVAESQVSQEL